MSTCACACRWFFSEANKSPRGAVYLFIPSGSHLCTDKRKKIERTREQMIRICSTLCYFLTVQKNTATSFTVEFLSYFFCHFFMTGETIRWICLLEDLTAVLRQVHEIQWWALSSNREAHRTTLSKNTRNSSRKKKRKREWECRFIIEA